MFHCLLMVRISVVQDKLLMFIRLEISISYNHAYLVVESFTMWNTAEWSINASL